jgi:hypothetical protein
VLNLAVTFFSLDLRRMDALSGLLKNDASLQISVSRSKLAANFKEYD